MDMLTVVLQNLAEVTEKLNGIHKDLCLLQSGDWVPDHDSCEASIEAVEDIAGILGIELTDEDYVDEY
jgi:hypothetical protein